MRFLGRVAQFASAGCRGLTHVLGNFMRRFTHLSFRLVAIALMRTTAQGENPDQNNNPSLVGQDSILRPIINRPRSVTNFTS